MKSRTLVLSVTGGILVVSAFLISANIIPLLNTFGNWQEQRKIAREKSARRDGILRDYQEAINKSKDGNRRVILELEYRLLKDLYEHQKVSSLYKEEEPIDQFVAFLIARSYQTIRIGIISDLGVPVERDGRWEIPITIGCRPGRSSIVWVDPKKRSVTCENFGYVENIGSLLRQYEAVLSKEAVH